MKDEVGALRRELDRIGTRRGRCVPRELKARVSAWLRARRAEGRTAAELAADLGIATGTVLRWSEESVRAVVPVQASAASFSHRIHTDSHRFTRPFIPFSHDSTCVFMPGDVGNF